MNYRHVIDSLLRKPGLSPLPVSGRFVPSLVFRQAWEALDRQYAPCRADLLIAEFCIWRRVIWRV
ncbi:MAG: hypothetical protein IPM39_11785 [Chloroflexi bacterium]|nr:hypothetical protein [Chloroflexota bacterium]